MANLPASYVTVRKAWSTGGTNGKMFTVKKVKITVPAADVNAYGDASTNPIPATSFGFRKLNFVSNIFVSHSTEIVPTAFIPTLDESGAIDQLMTYDLTNATDATRATAVGMVKRVDAGNPGIFYLTVEGY